MRIILHIGPDRQGSLPMQQALAGSRATLAQAGILYPRAAGDVDHARLFMAVSDPMSVDPLRFEAGWITPERQAAERETLLAALRDEIGQTAPHTMILSAAQLGSGLSTPSEVRRLRDILGALSNEITILAHLDEQARVLSRAYCAQIMAGRTASLARDLALAGRSDWWQAALETAPRPRPEHGRFRAVHAAPHWLDYQALSDLWADQFAAGSVMLRSQVAPAADHEDLTAELIAAFGAPPEMRPDAPTVPAPLSAAWITRARKMNLLLTQIVEGGKRRLPMPLWRSLLEELRIAGPAIEPGALAVISDRFALQNAALVSRHTGLSAEVLQPDPPLAPWVEADPEKGFRASQYLLASMYRIDKATRKTGRDRAAAVDGTGATPLPALSSEARAIMPAQAIRAFEKLQGSSYAPHNRMGAVDEDAPTPAFSPVPPRPLAEGSTGTVIVGCMKDEAPYIVEWIAYHRSIGVDNFLIYTNDCSDGTAEILDRLQDMGIVQHRNNDQWKGKSPQQHALNQSLEEPVIRNAEWIIHIDVDEFINVRIGNGTLPEFLAAVPQATNVAMTWRMFGHNGITGVSDAFVIDQFDHCAPKFCPKPHTAWGFKTMTKNIGAYQKISCHRPNKLDQRHESRVNWVNGSGRDMTAEVARNGWRNSKKTIGYEMLQLNHYALRSAESFLIKRQRGRALHVDRSIGLNYWIRMDWSDFRDLTIKRNIPRLKAEYDRLLHDDILRSWHEKGLLWHRAKARDLLATPEFRALYDQALKVRLNETERVAYALALDMES